ncbi:MAG: sulfatase-like hydrolase/transferase [bacterium]
MNRPVYLLIKTRLMMNKRTEDKNMVTKECPNVLFLLIDSLRADMCFGENRTVKTSTIDALTQKGTIFTQAISTTSTTSPSVATIMTGLYPFAHGIRSLRGYKLNPNCTTLAEVLRENGYRTCGMVTGPLSKELGLDKGFDEYIYRQKESNLYIGFAKELTHYLKENCQKQPWFLFVHLFELHVSIRPLVEKCPLRRGGKNLYEKALSYLDYQLS